MSNINIPTQVSPFANFSQFPTVGKTRIIYIDQSANVAYYWNVSTSNYVALGAAVAVNWGSITGTLSAQTDLQNALNNKVDKVTGKGLSTNDYTTAEKNKLAGIQAGAEVNVNADWNATTGDAVILNKPTIPSTGDLVPYTGATASVDLGENDLSVRKVYLYDEVNSNFGSIHYTDGNFHIEDADGHKLFVIEDGFLQLHKTDLIQSNLWTTLLTVTRDHYLPDASGTLALLSDVSVKENSANKATTMTGNTGSNILFLTAKAIYDWAVGLFQPLLVSGTNIKTINGSSVLGSGDLVVGGGGGGIHNVLKPISGRRISYALGSSASGSNFTLARLTLVPFIPANTLIISEILMYCNILGVGSLCRLLIYSDNNGFPDAKLFESADLNLSTTGFKIATTSFTFNAGTTYWLGFHGGAITANVTCHNVSVVYPIANLGGTVNSANGYNVTASLGSAPANITSANLNTATPQWIGLTPA